MDALPARAARTARGNRLVAAALGPLVNRMVPSEPTPVTVKSGPARGLKVVIQPREEKFYWAGTHEPRVQDTLVEVLKPGATFWDIGAHCGFFTALASRLVGEAGRVVSFEPCPANRARLVACVEMNGLQNVEVRDVAVAGHDGEVSMKPISTSTTWRIVPAESGADDNAVTARRLDGLSPGLPVPDLVKIDVEGAELSVLEGASELLAGRRPPLLIEFHSEQGVTEARELLTGYSLAEIEERQWLATPAQAHRDAAASRAAERVQ